MGDTHMHTALETFEETFDTWNNSYLLVAPAGGLRRGYEVKAGFNGNVLVRRDDLDEAIEVAQERAGWRNMDGVIAFHPPEESDEEFAR